MPKEYKITTDVFSLPYKNSDSIIYAPMVGYACIANQQMVDLIAGLEKRTPDTFTNDEINILEELEEKLILNHPAKKPRQQNNSDAFMPTMLTLFPTNQCNLKCLYCYASAGDQKPLTMDFATAKTAIDYLVCLLKESNSKSLPIGFHGGGEPLYPWRFIQQVVGYVKDCCEKEGLTANIFSATNGLLNKKQLEWIVKNFTNLNVSFDVLPDIQNRHRPLPNGKPSFPYVDRTLKFLEDHQFSYGIRTTISAYNVELMQESIEFIYQHYNVKNVHFEPLFYCGRCKTNSMLEPDYKSYMEHFKKCEQLCMDYGLNFIYSGCRLEAITNTFCGVSRDNFSITPDGYITTCYEVASIDDPKSETFFYGRINPNGTIEINQKKRAFLKSLMVENISYCSNCFAKWHCGGECVAKLGHTDYLGKRGHDRCVLNRELLKNRITNLLEGNYKMISRQD